MVVRKRLKTNTYKQQTPLKATTSNDEKEQARIEHIFRNKKRKDILKALQKAEATRHRKVKVQNTLYERDNCLIALIKLFRNNRCQICNTAIKKKDGTNYAEAAHIIPKHKKGNELPSNIMVLCPNHHKEFDFGSKLIISKTENLIVFVLNGKKHSIDLAIN